MFMCESCGIHVARFTVIFPDLSGFDICSECASDLGIVVMLFKMDCIVTALTTKV